MQRTSGCDMFCDTFDVLFKNIFGSSGALVTKWPVTRKRLSVVQKE